MDFNKLTTISLLCLLSVIGCEPQPSPTEQPRSSTNNQVTTDKQSSNYICAHLLVKTDLVADKLTLTIEDKSYQLSQTDSASGSKYNSQNETVTFWQKGDSASLEFNGQRYSNCEKVTVQQATTKRNSIELPFTARGNEPGWMLRMSAEQIELTTDYGKNTISLPTPQVKQILGGYQFHTKNDAHSATLNVHKKLCYDSMSGRPFPAYVTLELDGETLPGCGGDPLDLLVGFEWVVEDIASEGIIDSSKVTINFNREGKIFGTSSCNSYHSSYEITGESLMFTPPVGTLKACPPTIMMQERKFLDLLVNVNRYDIDGFGALILTTDDGKTIIARQP